MDFDPRPPRAQGESIVPMINVVFLLLIFFLMTASIAPPDPLGVEPPVSGAAGPGEAPLVLQVAATGETAYAGQRGPAALDALVAEAGGAPVTVRADAGLPAEALARLLGGLAGRGLGSIELATAGP